MKLRINAFVAALLAAGLLEPANAALVITEAMPSSNGTGDWIELSNTSSTPVSLAGFKIDDNSFDFTKSVSLSGIDTIAPGEAVIFAEGSSSAVATFTTAWGNNLRVGTYSGSGVGLSSSGDGVIIFDASGTEQSRQSFGSATTGSAFHWNTNNSTATLSSVGDSHGSTSAANNDVGSPGKISTIAVADTPVAGTASNISDSSFTANWNTASGATGYIVEISTDNFVTLSATQVTDNTATSVAFNGLTASTAYKYRVRAVNTGGTSSNSNTQEVSTLAGNTPPVINGIVDNQEVSGVVGDLGDYYSTTGLVFTVSDDFTPAGSLIVTAASSNNAIATATATNDSGSITLKIVPIDIGYADITVIISDGSLSTTYTIKYASSSSASANATTRWLSGRSDLSSAVRADANTVLIADDEPPNVLLAYNTNRSGPPLATIILSDSLLGTNSGSDCESIANSKCDGESDIEAGAKLGSRIYWTGSHSNNKSGKIRPDRWRIFATDVSGSGAGLAATVPGYYQHLRTDLLAWDADNDHGLGANYLGLTASTTETLPPESPNLDGFSIEGLTFAPDEQAAWVAFRAPLVAAPGQAAATAGSIAGRTHALIVPVNNFTTLTAANHGGTAGSATFGAPIRLDLGGRGIREIQKNSTGQYLIIAGPPDTATGVEPKDFRLYTWDGSIGGNGEATNLELRSADLTSLLGGMEASPEGLLDLPATFTSKASVGILSDAGDIEFYNDGNAAKDLQDPFRKGRLDSIELGTSASGDIFIEQNDVQPGVLLESNEITVSGLATATKMTISSGEYSLNGGDYSRKSGITVNNGDTIKVRHLSSKQSSSSVTTILKIDRIRLPFKTTTIVFDTTPDTVNFTNITNAIPNTSVESDVVSITGINIPVDVSISEGEYRINGGAYTKKTGREILKNSDTVQVRHTTNKRAGKSVQTILKVGRATLKFKSATQ